MCVKYMLLVAFVATLQQVSAATENVHLEPGTYTSGNINEYVDNTLALIRPAIVKNGFDPFPIDQITQDFWFKFLFINYTGTIELRNGWLRDLSTIHRDGDATVKYDKKMVTLKTNLVVDSLVGDFDYSAKLFNLGPSGILTASIRKQKVRFSILIDFERIVFDLQDFELTDNAEVKLRMTGLGLLDFLLNIFVDTLTALFKNSVIKSIGKQIREALESTIDRLPPLLPPPPAKYSEELIKLIQLVSAEMGSSEEFTDEQRLIPVPYVEE